MDFVRKRGNNLHYWYDYVAIFCGSYIYFYPISDKIVKVVTKEKEQINYLESIDYEEYFLLKGCNRVENYADYCREA